MSDHEVQPPELTLLLTVARILRARLPELAISYQSDDLWALNEALKPWEAASNVVPFNPNEDAILAGSGALK